MQLFEVSGAVRPIYVSLGVKRLIMVPCVKSHICDLYGCNCGGYCLVGFRFVRFYGVTSRRGFFSY